jgi:hypothetical protein
MTWMGVYLAAIVSLPAFALVLAVAVLTKPRGPR